MVAASAVQTYDYISHLGDWELTRGLLAVALGSLLLKVTVPLYPSWWRNPTLLALLCAALLFDALCALGHGYMLRGARYDQLEASAAQVAQARATVSRLERELEALPAIDRPADSWEAAEAKVKGLLARWSCKLETDSKCADAIAPHIIKRDTAKRDEERATERQQRRDQLATELRKARGELQEIDKPHASPDPMAAMLARVLPVSERAASYGQTVLSLVLIEGGVLGGSLMLAKGLEAPSAPRPPEPKGPARRAPAPTAPSATGRRVASDMILDRLRELASGTAASPGLVAGGNSLEGSQRALALALGVTAPTLTRKLQELQAAGKVDITTSHKATRVVLL
jgi:hypothetical protein